MAATTSTTGGVLRCVPENDDIFNSVVVLNGGDIGKVSVATLIPYSSRFIPPAICHNVIYLLDISAALTY